MKNIESQDNKIIKKVKGLKVKKNRDKEGLFVVEGLRFVKEIPNSWEVLYYIISEKFFKNNIEEVKKIETIITEIYESQHKKIELYLVTDKLFDVVSDTENPQGLMAICKKRDILFEDVISKKDKKSFYIILEDLQDPANIGTIIRTADACNVDGIFLTKGCVDIYNPKVLRGTMGSFFHLPIVEGINIDEVGEYFKKNSISMYATHLRGEIYPYDLNLTESCVFLIGNEGKGLSNESANMCDNLVKIPMLGKAESLNASVATSVILYEVVRQRLI